PADNGARGNRRGRQGRREQEGTRIRRSVRLTAALLAAVLLSSTARTGAAQSPPNDSLTIGWLPPVLRLPLSVDTPAVQRPRAIEYSDAYYTRLTIHRYGS